MIKRILIPVDFSADSARAARWGFELCGQIACEILLVTVLDVGDLRVAMNAGLHGFENDEDLRKQVHGWIEKEYAKIIPSGATNIRRDIRRGVVEKEISEAAKQYEADLIVIGATGIGKSGALGSKTQYLMKRCNVPVVVVHA